LGFGRGRGVGDAATERVAVALVVEALGAAEERLGSGGIC
jgi:hypothetical protein